MTLAEVRVEISDHLADMQLNLFKQPPPNVTIIFRNPGHPDSSRDIVMGDDDLDEAVAVVHRLQAGEATGFTQVTLADSA